MWALREWPALYAIYGVPSRGRQRLQVVNVSVAGGARIAAC